MRFLFDEMLKRLASWARILGIDSQFMTGKSDTELLRYAEKNDLVFVTRDMPLTIRCQKRGVRFIHIRSDILEEQLSQLLSESGATVTFPEKTRCASCNGELDPATKEQVAGKVHPSVIERNDRFWICRSCGKVYWEGSHWKNIRRIYEAISSGGKKLSSA
jgi:uncharacterized protein with PIN domain